MIRFVKIWGAIWYKNRNLNFSNSLNLLKTSKNFQLCEVCPSLPAEPSVKTSNQLRYYYEILTVGWHQGKENFFQKWFCDDVIISKWRAIFDKNNFWRVVQPRDLIILQNCWDSVEREVNLLTYFQNVKTEVTIVFVHQEL